MHSCAQESHQSLDVSINSPQAIYVDLTFHGRDNKSTLCVFDCPSCSRGQ